MRKRTCCPLLQCLKGSQVDSIGGAVAHECGAKALEGASQAVGGKGGAHTLQQGCESGCTTGRRRREAGQGSCSCSCS